MATISEEKSLYHISPRVFRKGRGKITLAEHLEQYVTDTFPKYFTPILHDLGFEADAPYLLQHTYALLLDFHGTNPMHRISHKYLQAAGIRVIVDHCLRIGRFVNLKDLCLRLHVALKYFHPFPQIPIVIQLNLICESLRGKVGDIIVDTTQKFTAYFLNQGITYPKANVGISLYHAGLMSKSPLSIISISNLLHVSPSTLYLLLQRFPTFPQ